MKKMLVLLASFAVLSIFWALQASATAPARAIIADGTVKTSSGDLIHAGVGWYGKCYPDPTVRSELPEYWTRAKDAGLNAIRLTNWDERSFANGANDLNDNPCTTTTSGDQKGSWSIATNVSHLRGMVNNAAAAGMYVIITPGDVPGSFNKNYLTQFWTAAAAEFKNDTNVIFEMSNEPVKWHPNDYTSGNLDDFADIYKIMRDNAPDTMILSLCFSHADTSMVAKTNSYTNKVNALETGLLSWTSGKDAVSFHPYGTSTMQYINELKTAHAVIDTEWGFPGSGGVVTLAGNKYQGEALQENGISQMIFQAGRGDAENTRYFDFQNDARAKNYYWITPDSDINDGVSAWSHYDSLSNMVTASDSSANYSFDTSRLTRSTTDVGSVIYNVTGIGYFNAHIYSNNSFNGINFYVSRNGTDWANAPATKANQAVTSGTWKAADFTSTNALPSGTKYLKVEFSSTSAANDTQLGTLEVKAWTPAVQKVEDNLDAWSAADSYSNMHFGSGNPPYFGGDASRAVRITADPGYIIYRISDTQGFYAHIFSHDSFAGIDFSASSNGTSWTPVATTTDTAVATSNGWKGKYFQNTSALPTGTQYIKIQFSSTTDFFVTQLSEMKIFDVYLDYH